MRSEQFFGVQALRFLAAASVVVAHAFAYTGARFSDAAPEHDWLGGVGVWMFFAVSGFVMVLVTDRERTRTGSVDAGRFIRKRLARIVPLYWSMTTVKLLLVTVAGVSALNDRVDVGTILRSFFFVPTHNAAGDVQPIWGVGWTLVFEMAFYVIVMLAIVMRLDPIALAAPVLIGASSLWLIRPEAGSASWFYADPVVLYFLAGMIVGRWGHRRPFVAASLIGALGVLSAVLHSLRSGRIEVQDALISVVIVSLLLVVVRAEHHIARFLPRWIVRGGAASYSLYMTHPLIAPVVPLVAARLLPGTPWPLVVAAASVVPVLASPLLYRFVEQPLNRFGARTLSLSRLGAHRSARTRPRRVASQKG